MGTISDNKVLILLGTFFVGVVVFALLTAGF
jgi:hypothetical protein